jgi:hypothetical protein
MRINLKRCREQQTEAVHKITSKTTANGLILFADMPSSRNYSKSSSGYQYITKINER